MRGRRSLMVLAMLAVLSGGCAKKHSRTSPTPTPEPPPRQASTPPTPTKSPPAPPTFGDPLAGDLASVNRYVREQGLLADVLFDYNQYELRPDARRQLETNARFLRERPQFRIALHGHADERGTTEYNLALGQKRAASARSILDVLGVSADRLQATSYGEERPVCRERNENCWQRNRRVHFEIVERIQ